MFEIGWTEMLVIAVVMIVVVGPQDLPKMLRTFGRTAAKLRSMAGDFQKQFNEALKEAELDDVKKSVDELRSLNPANQLKQSLNPFEKAAADVRAGLQSLNPGTPPSPPPADLTAAEPLKNGATAMPEGEAAPLMASPEPAAVVAAAPVKKAAAKAAKPAPKKPNGEKAAAAKPAAPARKPAAPKPVAADTKVAKANGSAASKADAPKNSAANGSAKAHTAKPAAKIAPGKPAAKPAAKAVAAAKPAAKPAQRKPARSAS